MRASRLGSLSAGILLLAENDLDAICEAIRAEAPQLVIVDSIQTVTDAGFEGGAGSVTQVRESAARLMRLAKRLECQFSWSATSPKTAQSPDRGSSSISLTPCSIWKATGGRSCASCER